MSSEIEAIRAENARLQADLDTVRNLAAQGLALGEGEVSRLLLAADALEASRLEALSRSGVEPDARKIAADLRWADRCYLAAETLRSLADKKMAAGAVNVSSEEMWRREAADLSERLSALESAAAAYLAARKGEEKARRWLEQMLPKAGG